MKIEKWASYVFKNSQRHLIHSSKATNSDTSLKFIYILSHFLILWESIKKMFLPIAFSDGG